jgi:hypothetical protein
LVQKTSITAFATHSQHISNISNTLATHQQHISNTSAIH